MRVDNVLIPNPFSVLVRRGCAAAGVVAMLSAGAAAHDQVPGPPQSKPVLLKGGDLYTVSQGVLPSTDLLFENGRITKIAKGIVPAEGMEVIDVTGRRVYPGLIATRTTLGLVEIGAVRAMRDDAEVGGVTPEAAAYTAFNPDSEIIPTIRSHGITTAQVVPQGGPVAGRPFITHLDGWTREQSSVRNTSGLHIVWPPKSPRQGDDDDGPAAKDPEGDKAKIRRAFDDALAYAKVRAVDPKTRVDIRLEAMQPVIEGKEPLFITAEGLGEITEAVMFAREYGLRLVLLGGRESARATALLRENDVAVVFGDVTSLPVRADDGYDAPFTAPATLHAAGVRFCLSLTGSWQTRNLALDAGHAIAFGLPEDAALRAITLSPAEILGIADSQGSLDVGKAATLFVSEGDVMDTLGQRVVRMYIDGREVDLDNRHKELWRKYKQKP